MLTEIDHVAYIAEDRAAGVALLTETYDLSEPALFELPQFGLLGAFLQTGETRLEVMQPTDPAHGAARLAGAAIRLDHIAYAVPDIGAAAAQLRMRGARFGAPDGSPLDEPVELFGALHLWTAPGSVPGVTVQLIQR